MKRISMAGKCSKYVLLSVCAVLTSMYAIGNTINYTGGDADNPTNLCLGANWEGGVLPGADDVAVIDMANVAGTSLVMSASFNVSGLQFASPTKLLTIGPAEGVTDPVLTIGAGGITIPTTKSKTSGLIFRVPLALSADQTWDIGQQRLDTYCSISGTSALIIYDAYLVYHHTAPRYGGSIEYGHQLRSETVYEFKEAAKWAQSVIITGSATKMCTLKFNIPEEYYVADIFPAGTSFTVTDLYQTIYLNGNVDGKAIWTDAVGTMNITSQYVRAYAGEFNIKSGTFSPTYNFNVIATGENVSKMTVEGGELSVATIYGNSFLRVGANGINYFINGPREKDLTLEQSGGTVTAKSVGVGGISGDWKKWLICYAQYLMKGGTMNASAALVLSEAKSNKANKYTAPGHFLQTGGTATVGKVQFGIDNGTSDNQCNNGGFGFLDLQGGTFNLGADDFALGTSWNVDTTGTAVESNSSYRVRLAGGTLVMSGETLTPQIEVAQGAQPSVLSVTADHATATGSIWGDGTLQKTGSGGLALFDASRFKGKLDVVEGSVLVRGSYSDADDANCVKWTGDSAMANGYADGEEVEVWPEANNGGLRQATSYDSGKTFSPTLPTLVENAFNGHAGVAFDGTAGMAVPALQNPTATQSVFTVVTVFKGTALKLKASTGETAHDWSYCGFVVGANMGTWNSGGWGLSTISKPTSYGLTFGIRHVNHVNSTRGGVDDGKVHVVVATLEPGGVGTVNVDGSYVRQTLYESFSKTTFSPLFFGFHSVGNGIFDNESTYKNASFYGTFAEIRVYQNRALSEVEQNELVRSLMAKYGTAEDCNKVTVSASTGNYVAAAETSVDVPAATLAFRAEDLSVEDGEAVETWTATYGETAFVKPLGGGSAAPVFLANAANGKPALRFTAADKTALGLAAEKVPSVGKRDFAAAVVFRTTAEGTQNYQPFYSGKAVGCALLSTATKENWWGDNAYSISYRSHGTIGATYHSKAPGTANLNHDAYRFAPSGLDDGRFHVVVFSSRLTDEGKLRLMVDGHCIVEELTEENVLDSTNLKLGSYCAALATGYFTGDIAEVKLFDRALSRDEMKALTIDWTAKYDAYPLRGDLDVATIGGLGATNVTVASGAKLLVPYSATAPWTLTDGMLLSGEGEVDGSVRFGSGAAYDVASAPGIGDIQLADGSTVRFDANLPFDGTSVSSISGNIILDIGALTEEQKSRRTLLIAIDGGKIAEGTVFTIVNGPRSATAVYSSDFGGIVFYPRTGTLIVIK